MSQSRPSRAIFFVVFDLRLILAGVGFIIGILLALTGSAFYFLL